MHPKGSLHRSENNINKSWSAYFRAFDGLIAKMIDNDNTWVDL